MSSPSCRTWAGLLPLTLAVGAGCKTASEPPERAPYAWVDQFGATGATAQPASVALNVGSDLVVTGTVEGALNLGAESLTSGTTGSMFVLQLGSDGKTSWGVPWAGSEGDNVGTDPKGNVLAAGHVAAAAPNTPLSEFFLAKLDQAGNKVWQTPLTFTDTYAPLKLAVSGGGFSLLSARATDAFVMAMVDPMGSVCWGLSFPLSCTSAMAGIATNASSQSAITGSYDCPVDFGGGPLTANGNGNDSMFVATFDADGNAVWSKGFAVSGGTARGSAVAVDDAGDVFVAGNYTGSPNFGGEPLMASSEGLFVLALDAKGTHLWSRGYDGAAVVPGGSLSVAPSGAIFVMAAASAPVDLGGNGPEPAGTLVFTLTAKGEYSGANRFAPQGASSFTGAGIAVGAQGQVGFAGSLTGSAAFGSSSFTSIGTSDIVAGLLAP
jgi:hypothetical protein